MLSVWIFRDCRHGADEISCELRTMSERGYDIVSLSGSGADEAINDIDDAFPGAAPDAPQTDRFAPRLTEKSGATENTRKRNRKAIEKRIKIK